MAQTDSIKKVQDAEAKASNMVADAEKRREELVSNAKNEANAILEKAKEEADRIMKDASASAAMKIESMRSYEKKEIENSIAGIRKKKLAKRKLNKVVEDSVDLIIGR